MSRPSDRTLSGLVLAFFVIGVVGPVVGATFTALKKTGVIKPADAPLLRSSGASANGHHIFLWIGVAA